MEAKVCSKCKEWKSASCFSKDKSRRDGLSYRCKACSNKNRKEYRDKNKEKEALYRKKYNSENRCKKIESQKRYRENNREKIREKSREYQKLYYKENREKIREKFKKYYNENKEKLKDERANWGINNRDKEQKNSKKYYRKNKNKFKSYAEKIRKEMSDSYIKKLMNSPYGLIFSEIPIEMVEIKRKEIQYLRESKQLKQQLKD